MDEDTQTDWLQTWGLKEETDLKSISTVRSTELGRQQRREGEAAHEAEEDLASSLALHKEEGAKHELTWNGWVATRKCPFRDDKLGSLGRGKEGCASELRSFGGAGVHQHERESQWVHVEREQRCQAKTTQIQKDLLHVRDVLEGERGEKKMREISFFLFCSSSCFCLFVYPPRKGFSM